MFTRKVIGNKKEFAIEYLVTNEKPHVMGNICLWVGNKYIGYFDSRTMLGVAVASLTELIEHFGRLTINDSTNLTAENIYTRVNSDAPDGLSSIHLFILTETTDDFSIRVYEESELLVFIWKLYETPSFNYPKYGYELNKFSVNKNIFENVVFKFRDEIESIQKGRAEP